MPQLLGQAPPTATGDRLGDHQHLASRETVTAILSNTLAAAAWKREQGQTGSITCPMLFGHQMARLDVELRLCSLRLFSHSPCGPQTQSRSPQWRRTPAPSPAPHSCQAPAGGGSIVSGDWGPTTLDTGMGPGWEPGCPGNHPAPKLKPWGWGGKFKALEGMYRWRQTEAGWFSAGLQSQPATSLCPQVLPLKALPLLGSLSPPLLLPPSGGSRDAFPGRKEVSQGSWREEQPKPEWDHLQPSEEVITTVQRDLGMAQVNWDTEGLGRPVGPTASKSGVHRVPPLSTGDSSQGLRGGHGPPGLFCLWATFWP